MGKIVAILLIVGLVLLFFWRYLLKIYLFIFVPEKYTLKGEMKVIKEEHQDAFLWYDSVCWETYSVEIKNSEGLTVLPLDFVFYIRLYYLTKTEGKMRILSCKKYAWEKKIKIVDIN